MGVKGQNIPLTDYVRNKSTSDDLMLQPTTTDSTLESGGSTDIVGAQHLVPPDPVLKVNGLEGKEEW